MPELGRFAEIAPYLTHPLVLAGFCLLLFFGLLRAVLRSGIVPTVSQSAGGKALLALLRYGFVIALVVIVLGFALAFFEHWRSTDELAQLRGQLEARVAELEGQKHLDQETIASLNIAHQDLLARAGQPGASPSIKEAAAKAAAGDNAAAEEIYAEILSRKSKEGAEANAEAAEAARNLGALASLSNTTKAIDAYKEATRLDPDSTWSWIFLGRLYQQAGDLAAAEQAFREARKAAERADDERDVMVTCNEVGDVQTDSGALTAALASYEEGMVIAKRLIQRDPDDTRWQGDLSVSFNKIGDVQVAKGDLDGALAAYRDSLAISEKLAARDPGNALWQRDVVVSHWRLADLAEKRREPAEARRHWQAALAIAKELEASGRLGPPDAYFVETIEARIAQISAEAAPR